MFKRLAYFAVLVVTVFCFAASSAFAVNEKANELKAQLKEVRRQKARMTSEYKNQIQKSNKEADKKIDVLRKDFHATVNAILDEKTAEQKKVTDAYNKDMAPLKYEESRLVTELGPLEVSNFAKEKYSVK